MEEVHRPAPAAADALDPPEHLGHDGIHVDASRERMTVVAVRRHQGVVRAQVVDHSDRHRLLPDVEVHEAADALAGVELGAPLLEAPDPQHPPVQLEQVGRGRRVGREDGHGVPPSVLRSPSGRPSSRALRTRRMIFPLWVSGR